MLLIVINAALLHISDLVTHHERGEQGVHLVSDRLARWLRDLRDRDRGDAAMAAMRTDLNLTPDASLHERRKNVGEYPLRRVPPELRFEHLADAGERHRIDRDHLHRNRGALRRALAHPGFELAGLHAGAGLELDVADR